MSCVTKERERLYQACTIGACSSISHYIVQVLFWIQSEKAKAYRKISDERVKDCS
jgi:hypothetical protein